MVENRREIGENALGLGIVICMPRQQVNNVNVLAVALAVHPPAISFYWQLCMLNPLFLITQLHPLLCLHMCELVSVLMREWLKWCLHIPSWQWMWMWMAPTLLYPYCPSLSALFYPSLSHKETAVMHCCAQISRLIALLMRLMRFVFIFQFHFVHLLTSRFLHV